MSRLRKGSWYVCRNGDVLHVLTKADHYGPMALVAENYAWVHPGHYRKTHLTTRYANGCVAAGDENRPGDIVHRIPPGVPKQRYMAAVTTDARGRKLHYGRPAGLRRAAAGGQAVHVDACLDESLRRVAKVTVGGKLVATIDTEWMTDAKAETGFSFPTLSEIHAFAGTGGAYSVGVLLAALGVLGAADDMRTKAKRSMA